jgi:hypothetical protein
MTTAALSRPKLSVDQQAALDAIEAWAAGGKGQQIFSMGGLAGTGKSVTIGVFASRFEGLAAYIALTGRASAVLRNKLRAMGVECSNALRSNDPDAEQPTGAFCGTLHRLIYKPVVDKQTEEVLGYTKRTVLDRQYDLLVVDEASMISEEMLSELKEFGHPILLVGDHGQLSPVMSRSNSIIEEPDVRLEKIHRQAEGNPIIRAAHLTREGCNLMRLRNRLKGAPEVSFLRHAEFEHRVERPSSGSVVLCWTNRTRVTLNKILRKKAGMKGPPGKGEIVIALRNDPPVYNGMRGILAADAVVGAKPWLLRATIAFPEDGLPPAPMLLNAAQFNRAEGVFASVEDLRDRGIDVASMKMAGAAYDFGYCLSVHKCLDPQTIVETPDGLRRLGAVKSEGQIATPYGRARYSEKVAYDRASMLEIETTDGYVIRTTRKHGLDVWDENSGYVRREAYTIKQGDFLRLRLGAEFDTDDKPLDFEEKSLDVRAKRHSLPEKMSPALAEFLGLFVADGTLYRSGFRLAKHHRDVADRFETLSKELFGAKVSRFFKLNAYHAEVSSTQLVDWLDGFKGLRPNKKDVPDQILGASLKSQAAFLRGLFEDGTVNVKDGMLDHVEYTSEVPSVREAVRTMLLRFGIVAGRTTNRPYSLFVYGGHAKRFGEQIGFVSSFKNGLLDAARCPEHTRYVFPLLKGEIIPPTKHKRREIQRSRALTSAFDDRRRFHHSRVASIRPYEGPAQCVEVPEGHQFIQSGFCGWNSQGSTFKTVSIYLDRPEAPYSSEYRRWLYTAMTRAAERLSVFSRG